MFHKPNTITLNRKRVGSGAACEIWLYIQAKALYLQKESEDMHSDTMKAYTQKQNKKNKLNLIRRENDEKVSMSALWLDL